MADQIELEVPERLDGARVDKTIAELLGVSRAEAAAIVARGVLFDGRELTSSDRLAHGQRITCSVPRDDEGLVPERIPFDVLFEDDSMIVVDKPAGIVVHPGSGQRAGTLAAGLIERFPDLVGVGSPGRWGLVHRLDKGTSGALCVARTDEAFESLTGQLRRREMSRTYTALVEGAMDAPTGTIEAPIARDPSYPTRQVVTHGGRHARTHFEVIRYYEGPDVSLLSVSLETGRTHQIRVHMSAIGHPVVGDWPYGAIRRELSPPRTLLHASSLELDHPVTGDRLRVEAPIPEDMKALIETLS